MFQVLDVKLDTKLKSPDSSFLQCCKLCAHCENNITFFPTLSISFPDHSFLHFKEFFEFLNTIFFISNNAEVGNNDEKKRTGSEAYLGQTSPCPSPAAPKISQKLSAISNISSS